MAWRLAESLKKLREQVNEAYPDRDRESDGSIGDAAHASRKSDHNPWVKDANGTGVVTAIDIDANLSPKTSVEVLVRQLFLAKDKRIKYIIWNRKITTPDMSGWKDYHGINAHQHHCHISVKPDASLYDSTAEWQLGLGSAADAPAVIQPKNERDMPTSESAEKPANEQAQPSIHEVVAGDNLWNLASRYQVSVAQLKFWNKLTSDKILVGQKLRVG